MSFEGLRSVCAKLEPPSSKSNELLEINVMQNLHHMLFVISVCEILKVILRELFGFSRSIFSSIFLRNLNTEQTKS